jgi:hypothetical protein
MLKRVSPKKMQVAIVYSDQPASPGPYYFGMNVQRTVRSGYVHLQLHSKEEIIQRKLIGVGGHRNHAKTENLPLTFCDATRDITSDRIQQSRKNREAIAVEQRVERRVEQRVDTFHLGPHNLQAAREFCYVPYSLQQSVQTGIFRARPSAVGNHTSRLVKSKISF